MCQINRAHLSTHARLACTGFCDFSTHEVDDSQQVDMGYKWVGVSFKDLHIVIELNPPEWNLLHLKALGMWCLGSVYDAAVLSLFHCCSNIWQHIIKRYISYGIIWIAHKSSLIPGTVSAALLSRPGLLSVLITSPSAAACGNLQPAWETTS